MTSTLSRPASAPSAPPDSGAETRALRQADPWHWLVTGAVLLTVVAAASSLNGVVEPWTWFRPVTGTLVPVLLVMALVRTVRPGRVLPTLVGLVALVGTLSAQFLPRQSILGVVPGPGSRLEVRRLLAMAGETVVSEVAPVLADPGILLVICASLGAVAILVDLLSTSLRMPAASGLALIVVMIPAAIVKPAGVGMSAFVVTVLAFLLLLAAAQWRENRLAGAGGRPSSGFVGRSLIITAAALAVTVALPQLIPGFTSGAFPQGSRLNVWGTASGLNPVVTLGNDLRNPSGSGRITYSTNSDSPVYLRAVTLEDFSGRRWEPDQRINDREEGVARIGAERGAPETTTGQTIYTHIRTQSYASPWLLSPYAPESVIDLAGNWAWDPANLSIMATDGGSTAGQDYLVRSRSASLTKEGLADVRPSAGAAVPEVFSGLPADTPEIVLTTTDDVAGDLVDPYDKALAIQSYLRGPEFTYSLEAPVEGGYDGSGMGVMAEFLELKAGYCVHYAGTMAVMARAAGIPSRVAIGYTPGTATGDVEIGPGGLELEQFTVDSRNAHAWPELYFEGVGWVRFEPTPSRGVVPAYAQQAFVPGGTSADDSDALNPRGVTDAVEPTTPQTSEATDQDGPGGTGEPAVAPVLVAGLLVAALALVVLLPLGLRTLRTGSRRRSATATGTPVQEAATLAWAETSDAAADHGYAPEPTETPRSFERRLARDAGLDGGAADSLSRLRSGYEHAEYAEQADPSGPALHPVDGPKPGSVRTVARQRPVAQSWGDVDAVTAALRRGSPLSVRIRARLLPRSLWTRSGRTLR
ncbi:transglutaminase [Arthrobacter echini]|uniref:Transglutaminase n=1 Tax=Arthrobacter echini TaxID=1529066 RepID=A0A4V3Z646_9MICC|nr:DUF3488 and transglutaminase-like domain-containing protein [Arthrobacter echini]THJ67869.1 transglutaminase [Arthrobacter echini]